MRPAATLLTVAAVLACVWTLVARITGPDDLWDQTQPATVSYTTDIVANGRWVLPVERGAYPATKPPLYNWLAAPAVAVFGCASTFAHKLPSVLAFLACVFAVGRAGRTEGAAVGALAALAFASAYPTFKLAYLARPDMLLTLWLVLGWLAATRVIAGGGGRDAFVLWACVALAALTKGPPALLLVAYVFVAAPLLGGRAALRATRWPLGLPLALVPIAAWLAAAWAIDPAHVRGVLFFDEIAGRVSGTGPEGGQGGPGAILRGALDMPVYFLVRFLPWSIAALLGVVAVVRLRPGRIVPAGAAVYVGLALLLFSLSAGKRADYIASAYGPGAVLAAWWLLGGLAPALGRAGRFVPAGAVAAAVVALAALTVTGSREPAAPQRGFGDAIMAFVRDAEAEIARRPGPVAFHMAGTRHLQAMLGASRIDGPDDALALVAAGEPFWLVEGEWERPADGLGVWVRGAGPAAVEHVLTGPDLEMLGGWPGRVHLFRIEPHRSGTR